MRYVTYVGLSQQRMVTARDWQSVGIQADTAVWSAFNGFAVPLDQFTDEQVARAFKNDPSFVITGEGEGNQDEFQPTFQVQDMTPAQAKQAAEAPVDVVELLDGGSVPSPTGSGSVSDAPDVRATTGKSSGKSSSAN